MRIPKLKAQVWIASAVNGSTENSAIEVLLFLMRPERGGFWQPITGGVEPRESPVQGAARELQEESGFPVSEAALIDLRFSYRFHGRWGEAEESVFLYPMEKKLTPTIDPTEHIAFEWVSAEEARRRITFPEQLKALALVEDYFSHQN